MDRENVIEYLSDGILMARATETKLVHIDADTAEGILAMLKEQEAAKPYIDIDEAKCPICKVKLTRQELLGEDVLFEDFFDYCPRCGRKVEWQ